METQFRPQSSGFQRRDNFATSPQVSARSDTSAESTGEFLSTKMKSHMDKADALQRSMNEMLGDYNEYSRPKPSSYYPLRSALLDPETNNFAPSKTRSELMKKIKQSGLPHSSYDIDGDGWVSRDDYFIAKRFDLDGNGVIDPDERMIAKKIVAEEFFSSHMDNLHLFGSKYATRGLKENVHALAGSKVFERTYNRLKAIELKLRQGGSKEMVEGMTLADKRLVAYNFYCNKFDSTAWTDSEAIPREAAFTLPSNGSRKKMIFARKQRDIQNMEDSLQATRGDSFVQHDFRRVNKVTDYSYEND